MPLRHVWGQSVPSASMKMTQVSQIRRGWGPNRHWSLGGRAGWGLVLPREHWIPGPGPYVKSSPPLASLAIREQCSQNT